MQHVSDQRGVTLIELLVAMAMSTVVIFAASAIIISALNVTQQVTGRETAMAQGRTGIETLLGQLNSGCLVNSTSPVQLSTSGISSISPTVASDASDLVFVSGVGDSATPTPTLHVVQVNGSGALLDSAYSYTPGPTASLGTPSTWTFSRTPSQVLNLAQNVTVGSSGQMFTYYAYSSAATSTDSLLGASALSLPLTSTTAPTVAEVDLDFRFAPPGHYQTNQTSELQDSAVFSLTAQDTSAQNGPCQ